MKAFFRIFSSFPVSLKSFIFSKSYLIFFPKKWIFCFQLFSQIEDWKVQKNFFFFLFGFFSFLCLFFFAFFDLQARKFNDKFLFFNSKTFKKRIIENFLNQNCFYMFFFSFDFSLYILTLEKFWAHFFFLFRQSFKSGNFFLYASLHGTTSCKKNCHLGKLMIVWKEKRKPQKVRSKKLHFLFNMKSPIFLYLI